MDLGPVFHPKTRPAVPFAASAWARDLSVNHRAWKLSHREAARSGVTCSLKPTGLEPVGSAALGSSAQREWQVLSLPCSYSRGLSLPGLFREQQEQLSTAGKVNGAQACQPPGRLWGNDTIETSSSRTEHNQAGCAFSFSCKG